MLRGRIWYTLIVLWVNVCSSTAGVVKNLYYQATHILPTPHGYVFLILRYFATKLRSCGNFRLFLPFFLFIPSCLLQLNETSFIGHVVNWAGFIDVFFSSKVRQNPKLGSFFVQGLKKVAVGSYKEIEKRTEEGSVSCDGLNHSITVTIISL